VRYGALFVALTLLAPPAAAEDAVERQTEVGPVQATLRLTPAQPVIGDPLTLEIEVRAEPGVEVLMPEFGEALDRFAIVDFVPSETVDDEGRTIARQRYRLQPSRSGSQRIPPILVEFVDRRPGQTPAPEGADAHELLTERLEFEVTSVLPEDAALELRPARGELPPLEASGPRVWAFVVVGLALLAALSPWLVRFWLAYRARARQRSAFDLAYAELEALLAGPRPAPDVPAAMDRFFVKLSGIVRRYLERRFGLRSPELTTEEFLEVMTRSPDLSAAHQALLQTFLRRADLVKFAHHVPEPAAVEDSIGAARRFLDETRDDLVALAPRPVEAAHA
jgi:hypothetical protein